MITQLTANFSAANHKALVNLIDANSMGFLRVIKSGHLDFVSFKRRITNPTVLQVTCHLHEPVSEYSHALQVFKTLLAHAFKDDDHNLALVADLETQIQTLVQQTSLI